ncbi:hypothetical protein R5R73_01415 [Salinicola sp. LHM]|uniref:P-loop ATPase, Sll1717 family n=1 Tax=Salinicola sp. LHM TaxID=3065298 RepID=UPI002ACD897A|nr:hypothetical protein [Salinicola sp. LHM]WQH33385.1 hypothetical protein R5R73_01415 [Salinicola sp. LHM]
MAKRNSHIYKEIAAWNVEAKQEDMGRYFYKSLDIEKLLEGERSFVIGRKGTGKTAIAQYLIKLSGHDHFAQSLSLKNFPFNTLYEKRDSSYTAPNQYVTIWKHIIYTKLLYLLCDNENIDSTFVDSVRKTIPRKPRDLIGRNIVKTLGRNFSLGFATLKASMGYTQSSEPNEIDWVDRVDALESIILDQIDNSKYFIIFDELDEDYRHQSILGGETQYTELLIGLFKAVQDVKSTFSSEKHNVNPIIFLRDDIYSIIQNHDKSKWDDRAVKLSWTKYTIQAMVAHRISKAINPSAPAASFGKAWYRIVEQRDIRYGWNREKEITSYDWITQKTFLRPRDYIRYLKICAKKAYEANDDIIRPESITTQIKNYSTEFRQEIVDEVHTLIPDIEKIFTIISRVGKTTFKQPDFTEKYETENKSDWIRPEYSAEYVMRLLFLFSIVGNHARNNVQIFRYLDPASELDLEKGIIVHPALQKALQLI